MDERQPRKVKEKKNNRVQNSLRQIVHRHQSAISLLSHPDALGRIVTNATCLLSTLNNIGKVLVSNYESAWDPSSGPSICPRPSFFCQVCLYSRET